MRKTRLVAAVTAALLTGCGPQPTAAAAPIEAELDHEFGLPGGQEATVRGTDLHLRFSSVLEDSRCPTEVACVWSGQARIAVEASQAGHDPTTIEFNTNPAVTQNISAAQVGDYTIELWSLDPYPQTPEQSTPLEDYRATLTVRATG